MVVVFDLDDTLYPEMDFVRSSYRAIAKRYGNHLLPRMMNSGSPRDAFDSTGLPVSDVIELYRNHIPDICLPWQSLYVLSSLSAAGCILGLITDGRSITQRHKIEALGLYRFIHQDLIFISEEIGSEKLSGAAFKSVMEIAPGQEHYIYIGDNPDKDFVVPNKLGWITVGYKRGGCGENIFVKDFDNVAFENRPLLQIENLVELLEIVNFFRFGKIKSFPK